MEEIRLIDVQLDAARSAVSKVETLRKQAEMLFAMLAEQAGEEDSFYPLGIKAEITSDKSAMVLDSPYAKGRILFEPRADSTGPIGLYRLQRSERDQKDEPVWVDITRFTLNADSIVSNADGKNLLNLARPYRGQAFEFLLSIASALAVLR